MKKTRTPFVTYKVVEESGELDRLDKVGFGVFYPYGANVQYYPKSQGYAAIQHHSISDVLLYDDVDHFAWGEDKKDLH